MEIKTVYTKERLLKYTAAVMRPATWIMPPASAPPWLLIMAAECCAPPTDLPPSIPSPLRWRMPSPPTNIFWKRVMRPAPSRFAAKAGLCLR